MGSRYAAFPVAEDTAASIAESIPIVPALDELAVAQTSIEMPLAKCFSRSAEARTIRHDDAGPIQRTTTVSPATISSSTVMCTSERHSYNDRRTVCIPPIPGGMSAACDHDMDVIGRHYFVNDGGDLAIQSSSKIRRAGLDIFYLLNRAQKFYTCLEHEEC